MKRIFLFLATNIAILVVLSIVLNLLGVDRVLDEQGVDLDYGNLMVFAAVFGFGGSFISLAISKWMAKRTTGAVVIEQPRNDVEAWLLQTVGHQAQAAGIKMPEVAVFPSDQPNAFATGRTPGHAAVAATTGLLSRLTRDEIAGVMAHELAHVRNRDTLIMTITATIAGAIGMLANFALFFGWEAARRRR